MKNRKLGVDVWLWLTVPIVILVTIAAGCGVFVSGLYKDTPIMVAQAVGQDVITLIVAVPALAIAAFLTARGSQRARLIWLGALVYVVYTYIGYAFDVRFNSLFLVYVALLGCSTYALIGGLVTTEWTGIQQNFTERTPVKAVSVFLCAAAILFYLLWLSEALPASISGKAPESLIETGTPTNFIHVLDMAWLLPAMLIAAASLWRRLPLGYSLAAVLLSKLALLALAILAMVVFMVRSNQSVSAPQAVIFGTLFAISLALLIVHLRNLKTARATR